MVIIQNILTHTSLYSFSIGVNPAVMIGERDMQVAAINCHSSSAFVEFATADAVVPICFKSAGEQLWKYINICTGE